MASTRSCARVREPEGAARASPWTSGFEPLGKSGWLDDARAGMVESWEFEEDTYTFGIVSVVESGIPGGLPHIAFALLTPTIQLAAFFRIYEHIMAEPRTEATGSLYVRLICFLLMALQLSNEALEGFRKLVFGVRCLTGVYERGGRCSSCLASLLGFMQMGMSMGTVGLSMVVVSEQTTALDAFMNFVALAFLTEVDNIIMSARTVKNFVSCDPKYVAVLLPGAFEQEKPWDFRASLIANLIVAPPSVINAGLCCFTAAWSPDVQTFDMAENVTGSLVVAAALNLAMWFGSRRCSHELCSMAIVIGCLAFDILDKSYLYATHERLFSPLTGATVWWYECAFPAVSIALQRDPFCLLACPLRSPFLVWAMLVQSVFIFGALYHFGVNA